MSKLATRVIKARRETQCPACRDWILTGQLIAKTTLGWLHATCAIERQADEPREPMIGWHSGE
jgi:hypothetical protein